MSTGIFDTEESENATSRNNVFQLRKRIVVEVSNLVELTKDIAEVNNVIELNSVAELSSLSSACEVINVVELTPVESSETAPACMNGICSINWKPKRPTAA